VIDASQVGQYNYYLDGMCAIKRVIVNIGAIG